MFLNKTDRNVLIVNEIHRLKLDFLRKGFMRISFWGRKTSKFRLKKGGIPYLSLHRVKKSRYFGSEVVGNFLPPYETLRTFVGIRPKVSGENLRVKIKRVTHNMSHPVSGR